jgi:hypothetical protein
MLDGTRLPAAVGERVVAIKWQRQTTHPHIVRVKGVCGGQRIIQEWPPIRLQGHLHPLAKIFCPES